MSTWALRTWDNSYKRRNVNWNLNELSFAKGTAFLKYSHWLTAFTATDTHLLPFFRPVVHISHCVLCITAPFSRRPKGWQSIRVVSRLMLISWKSIVQVWRHSVTLSHLGRIKCSRHRGIRHSCQVVLEFGITWPSHSHKHAVFCSKQGNQVLSLNADGHLSGQTRIIPFRMSIFFTTSGINFVIHQIVLKNPGKCSDLPIQIYSEDTSALVYIERENC